MSILFATPVPICFEKMELIHVNVTRCGRIPNTFPNNSRITYIFHNITDILEQHNYNTNNVHEYHEHKRCDKVRYLYTRFTNQRKKKHFVTIS